MTIGTLTESFGSLAPYVALIVFGFLPSEVWRWLAVLLARDIQPDSELFAWVRLVSTALLCGVVAKLVLLPPGALGEVPMPARLVALASGLGGYVVLRRSVFAGVAVGSLVLVGIAVALPR